MWLSEAKEVKEAVRFLDDYEYKFENINATWSYLGVTFDINSCVIFISCVSVLFFLSNLGWIFFNLHFISPNRLCVCARGKNLFYLPVSSCGQWLHVFCHALEAPSHLLNMPAALAQSRQLQVCTEADLMAAHCYLCNLAWIHPAHPMCSEEEDECLSSWKETQKSLSSSLSNHIQQLSLHSIYEWVLFQIKLIMLNILP